MLRYKTKTRPGLGHLVGHLARKWNGSVLTTPEPTRGYCNRYVL